MWTKNFQMFKLDVEKEEEPEIKLPTSIGSQKKQRGFLKVCFFDYTKGFVWITRNYGKFLKRWEYQTTLPASWEICTHVKKQQLELNMEQWTGSKLEKEYVKAGYCNTAYLTCMQSTSHEMPGWMTRKL